MKLKEKLAEEFLIGIDEDTAIESDDIYFNSEPIILKAYLAGFEKCREMASDIASDYEPAAISDRIEDLGEEEV